MEPTPWAESWPQGGTRELWPILGIKTTEIAPPLLPNCASITRMERPKSSRVMTRGPRRIGHGNTLTLSTRKPTLPALNNRDGQHPNLMIQRGKTYGWHPSGPMNSPHKSTLLFDKLRNCQRLNVANQHRGLGF